MVNIIVSFLFWRIGKTNKTFGKYSTCHTTDK
nr:MAG TPA: hypothetical protein [Caudoviricetes sp.]